MLQYGFNTIINHQFGMVITIILWQGSGLVSYFTTNEPSRFMKDPLFCSVHHWRTPLTSIHHHPRVNWNPPGWVAMAHEVGICWLRTHLAPHQDASVHTVAAGALHPFPTWAGSEAAVARRRPKETIPIWKKKTQKPPCLCLSSFFVLGTSRNPMPPESKPEFHLRKVELLGNMLS